VTDKKTIELIERMASKFELVQIETAKNTLLIRILLWIMGAILVAILPAFGFLIAFWVQNG
jgi:hypothetical protein